MYQAFVDWGRVHAYSFGNIMAIARSQALPERSSRAPDVGKLRAARDLSSGPTPGAVGRDRSRESVLKLMGPRAILLRGVPCGY